MSRLPVCLLAMLLLCVPMAAEAVEAGPAAPGPLASAAGSPAGAPASANDDLLNRYNRIIFAINREVYAVLGSVLGWNTPAPAAPAAPESAPPPAADAPPPVPSPGPSRVISNLINEPLTALSSVVVGDFPTAWNAVQRFGINSTVGVLGWWDEASTMGYKPEPADVGLALCRWGVGEGGYVMLPFIGPRTFRDGFSDVVLVNALLWSATAAVFSSGLSLQTIIIAESIEVAADIVAVRQIDPRAKSLSFDDYEKQRADYLAERRLRCGPHRDVAVAEVPAAR